MSLSKAEIAEYHRQYRLRNAAKLKEKKKAYYAKRREHFKKAFAEYRAKNGDKLRAYDRLRRGSGPQKEKKKAADKEYREKNRDVLIAKRVDYFDARKPITREYGLVYRAANAGRIKARQLAYYSANKPAYVARVVKRNAQKKQAVPKWANEFFIEEAYHLAALRTKMLGYPWHVDHIVPLQSKLVCGLHVHNNLRVIPGSENLAKGNRYWPQMP